jgi:hypothetical protein
MHFPAGLAAALAALAFFSADATAQRFYVGASGGTTHVEALVYQPPSVSAQGPTGTIVLASAKADTSGVAGRIFAGLRLTDALALEADYTRLGEIAVNYGSAAATSSPMEIDLPERTDSRASAFGIVLVARALLSDRVALFGRAGAARIRLDHEATWCTLAIPPVGAPQNTSCFTESGRTVEETRPVAGFGFDWRVAERLAIRASWDRYFGAGEPLDPGPPRPRIDRGEFDIDYFGVGVTYAF